MNYRSINSLTGYADPKVLQTHMATLSSFRRFDTANAVASIWCEVLKLLKTSQSLFTTTRVSYKFIMLESLIIRCQES